MTQTLDIRVEINDEALRSPLENGAGPYLRYEPIYDQIREARREDDASLSMGIWETEIKKADWLLVEKLCSDVLQNQSKDIQVSVWLTEAWLNLDGFSGGKRGFELMKDLCEIFWQEFHPQLDGEDIEHRLRIFEWANETFAHRLMFIPITAPVGQSNLPSFSLADWNYALNLDTVSKRSTDANSMISAAEIKGNPTLGRFRKGLQQTSADSLNTTLQLTHALTQTVKSLSEVLIYRCGAQAPSFQKILDHLVDISRICKTAQMQKTAELPLTEENVSIPVMKDLDEESLNNTPKLENNEFKVTGRQSAYQSLKEIADFLEGTDLHSPTPHILHMVVSWENKSLPEILISLSEGQADHQLLMQLLGFPVINSGAKLEK